MAWARRLPSGLYAGQYRGRDGKIRTALGGPWSRKSDAERAAATAETDARSAGWHDPAAGFRPWREWCAEWWPTRPVEPSTLRRDENRRDTHLLPRWGDVAIADITRQDVRAWAADLGAGRRRADGTTRPLAPATVQRCVHLLSASLQAAVDATILPVNPIGRLGVGGPSPIVERFLTREEYARARAQLVELVDDPAYPRMADLLVGTGMRWGEAAATHDDRVHRERRILSVIDAWDESARLVKPYPKGKRRREAPLPDWIVLPEPSDGVRACGYTHSAGRCRSGLLITTRAGTMLDGSAFRRRWTAACEAAGLGHVRVHDLRHTYASWLLQSGIPLAQVGKLLGHISPLTTARYAHLGETPAADVLAALTQPTAATPPSARTASASERPPASRGHLRAIR